MASFGHEDHPERPPPPRAVPPVHHPMTMRRALSRTGALVLLIVLLVAGVLAATVWLAAAYERNDNEEALSVATEAAVASMRGRLADTEHALGLLAARSTQPDWPREFDAGALHVLREDPALLRIERRAADGTLLAAVDSPEPRPRVDERERITLGFESSLAKHSAMTFSRAVYSRPHYIRMPDGYGFEITELAVPWGHDPGGSLLAVYSLPRMLDRLLPADFRRANQIHLSEVDGTFVARATSGLRGAGAYTASAPLELPGVTLLLRANSVQPPPRLLPNLLAAMLAAATLALVASSLALWRDSRRRVAAEQALRDQQERMQAHARLALLGEVASALSHELNQPLAAITSYATACENLVGAANAAGHEALQTALGRIRTQSERAGQVIRSVQAFVRRRRIEREPIALDELLRGIEPLIALQARKFGARVAMHVDGPATVTGDRTMLEQAVLNLTRNAVESMDDAPPATRVLEIEAGPHREAERQWIRLAVKDRGRGVDAQAEPRIFNAFFTTKPDGLGIGLSLCRSVIEAHGGQLRHERRGGGGSVFSMMLPS